MSNKGVSAVAPWLTYFPAINSTMSARYGSLYPDPVVFPDHGFVLDRQRLSLSLKIPLLFVSKHIDPTFALSKT